MPNERRVGNLAALPSGSSDRTRHRAFNRKKIRITPSFEPFRELCSVVSVEHLEGTCFLGVPKREFGGLLARQERQETTQALTTVPEGMLDALLRTHNSSAGVYRDLAAS